MKLRQKGILNVNSSVLRTPWKRVEIMFTKYWKPLKKTFDIKLFETTAISFLLGNL